MASSLLYGCGVEDTRSPGKFPLVWLWCEGHTAECLMAEQTAVQQEELVEQQAACTAFCSASRHSANRGTVANRTTRSGHFPTATLTRRRARALVSSARCSSSFAGTSLSASERNVLFRRLLGIWQSWRERVLLPHCTSYQVTLIPPVSQRYEL